MCGCAFCLQAVTVRGLEVLRLRQHVVQVGHVVGADALRGALLRGVIGLEAWKHFESRTDAKLDLGFGVLPELLTLLQCGGQEAHKLGGHDDVAGLRVEVAEEVGHSANSVHGWVLVVGGIVDVGHEHVDGGDERSVDELLDVDFGLLALALLDLFPYLELGDFHTVGYVVVGALSRRRRMAGGEVVEVVDNLSRAKLHGVGGGGGHVSRAKLHGGTGGVG